MGTNKVLGGGGFHHVAIKVANFDKTVSLYKDVFGFVEKIRWGEGDDRAVMLDTGDGNYVEVFAGGKPYVPAADIWVAGPIIHMCFRCKDVDGVTQKAAAAGFKVIAEPKDVVIDSTPVKVPLRLSFLQGPDGEVVELFDNSVT